MEQDLTTLPKWNLLRVEDVSGRFVRRRKALHRNETLCLNIARRFFSRLHLYLVMWKYISPLIKCQRFLFLYYCMKLHYNLTSGCEERCCENLNVWLLSTLDNHISCKFYIPALKLHTLSHKKYADFLFAKSHV